MANKNSKWTKKTVQINPIILGAAILVLLLLTVAGTVVYVGFVDKIKESFKSNPSEMEMVDDAQQISTDNITPLPTFAPTRVPVTATPSCTRYKIREGEFASDKCYSPSDLSDLEYNIQKYDMAIFNYNGTVNQVNVVCGGFTESFKQQCEQGKKDLEMYNKQIEDAKNAIRASIAKGR